MKYLFLILGIFSFSAEGARFGRLDASGKVVEVIETEKTPEDIFHPDLAKYFVLIPDEVVVGYIFTSEKWVSLQPSEDHILKDGEWVLDQTRHEEKRHEEQQFKDRKDAKDRLRGK
jgi:hypothetical protein